MDIIQQLDRAEIERMSSKKIDPFRPGDTVQVHCNVVEGNKKRIQIFEGVVIRRKGTGLSESICVRKISVGGIGVERVFPLYSPTVAKIIRTRQGRVRRARLFYLRDRVGKRARVREKTLFSKTDKEKKVRRKGRKVRAAAAAAAAAAAEAPAPEAGTQAADE